MEYYDVILRLSLACVFGLIIGAERKSRHKVAGLRTHVLVSLGSCLVMILSLEIASSMPNNTGDPGRMAAQVVSGIGFLGAGAILKEGISVVGLTTAASLWLMAAIGLATGLGSFFSASIATAFGFITLIFIGRFDKFLLREDDETISLVVVAATSQPPIAELSSLLASWGVEILDIKSLETTDYHSILVISFDSLAPQASLVDLIKEVRRIPGIFKVTQEE